MNALVTQAQLPAHLALLAQNTSLMALNQSAAAGISSGGWPRISLKAARFRLQQPTGEEIVVPQLHLDVIIVDANPHGVSKRYYAGKWDPNVEASAPDCYSDNGIGASSKALKPQSSSCATCPHNVWGSKISEASGKAIKACADLKKIAVLVADNTGGPVFELAIPADSMKNLAEYVKALDKHGVPMSTIITRLTFDPNVSYPKLVFSPAFLAEGQLPYINAEQAGDVMEVINTDEVDNCTGKNDVPVDPSRVAVSAAGLAQGPSLAGQLNQQQTATPTLPPVVNGGLPPVTNAVQGSFPLPAAPTGAPAAAPPPAAAPAKRTRKAKISPEAQTVTAADVGAMPASITQGQVEPPLPAFLQNNVPTQAAPALPAANTQQAANATAPLAPTGVTNSALDDMINQALGVHV